MTTLHRLLSAMALPVLGAAYALPAAAQTYTETYTGTVDPGSSDSASIFGGGALDGDTITEIWTYSLTNGATRITEPGAEDNIVGGEGYGGPDPIISVSVVINGFTVTMSDPNSVGTGATVICNSACNTPAQSGFAFTGNSVLTTVFDPQGGEPSGLIADLTAAQTSTIIPASDDVDSNFNFYGDNFAWDAISVSFSGAIPEPASVAAFGTGVLALSALHRRRRAGSTPARPTHA